MMSNPNHTPCTHEPALAKALGLESLYIKHEYQNPSGSHKDRTIWQLIDYYKEQGIKKFVISSSGNAAISAAYYTRLHHDILLDIFVSPNLPKTKQKRLNLLIEGADNINIQISKKAKADAFKLGSQKDYHFLRTSNDDIALQGYASLSIEICDQFAEHHDPIADYSFFVPTSSGTTLQGLYNGFVQEKVNPPLHIVQTTKVHPMAKFFDTNFSRSDSSLASAIVDTIAHRKDAVIAALEGSQGHGWVIDDSQLQRAKALLETNADVPAINWDNLLALAGLMKALNTGRDIRKAILLFCGK